MNMLRLAIIAAGMLLTGSSFAEAPAPEEKITVSIEAQPLTAALNQWAEQTGMMIMVTAEGEAARSIAPRVVGDYTPEQALAKLLGKSEFTYRFVNSRTVAIQPGKMPGGNVSSATGAGDAAASELHLARTVHSNAGGVADVSQDARDQTSSSSSTESTKQQPVQEIVVTAQKREERLQDVPVPVTAISAESLLQSNALRLQDYYNKIPGLTMTPGLASQQILTIRGVSTGTGTNPTVGVTVDDVPYGSTSNLGGGNAVPDIDPADLARIEVLRGPQGTLYGANSLGGLFKFVTLDPSTERFSGRIQAGMSSVRNGDDAGYNVRGAVNMPLGESVALRVSGYTRHDPGYVDDPVQGKNGVNSGDVNGGRLSLLWRVSDTFSLKLGALLQQTESDGRSDIEPAVGDLKQVRLPQSGQFDKKVQAYSAVINGSVGPADLTILSGYNVNRSIDVLDGGFLYRTLVQPVFNTTAAILRSDFNSSKFTQEVRATIPLSPRVDWLAGVFYTDEDRPGSQEVLAANAATGAVIASYRKSDVPTTYKEYAAFTDFTFHVTDRFDVQVGGRQSENKQTYEQIQTGPGATAAGNQPMRRTTADAFTYLFTPQFKMSPDLMTYARVASGYRPGGANGDPLTPEQYEPDTTRNYEIGAKGAVLGNALSFDASVYYIDWTDIQLFIINPTNSRGYNTNGGKAKSQGVELSIVARPLDGWSISAWSAWSDAKLTQDFVTGATVRGVSGDRLPFSSRWSGNLSIDGEFPIVGAVDGFVGASASFVGDRQGGFTAGAGVRQDLDAYTQMDLTAGLKWSSWKADFFLTNLTDERGALYGGLGGQPPTAFNYIRPRTIGFGLSRIF